jgi:hypothetical protein
LIPLKSNLKFNKSYDLIIATEPTGKREGEWILVMDKQNKKAARREKGGRGERKMLRSGWMREWKDLEGREQDHFLSFRWKKKACGWFPKRKGSQE